MRRTKGRTEAAALDSGVQVLEDSKIRRGCRRGGA
jgi:hypothetical protein